MRFRCGALAVVAAATTVLSSMAAVGATGPTYTVTAGSAPAGRTIGFSATSAQMIFDGVRGTGGLIACGAGSTTVNLSAAVGTGLSATHLARVAGSSIHFPACNAVYNQPLTMTGSGTWSLNAVGVPDGDGDLPVALSGVKVHAETSNASVPCSFDLHGFAQNLRYNSRSRDLSVRISHRPNLTVSNVVGCATLQFGSGQLVGFQQFNFVVSANNSAYDPLTITSP